MKKILFVAAAAALALLCSCSSTSLVTSWKAANAPKVGTYQKVMVVGMMGAKDLEMRQKGEAAVVQTLAKSGVAAVSSYELLGPKEFRKMSEQEVVAKLKNDSVDAVMFVVLLDRAKEKDWVPGAVYYTPYAGAYYGCYWCHYNMMYGRVYSPGYFSTTTTYILEVDLYSVADNKLQYSAHIKSVDPNSVASLSQNFSNLVINDLTKKGLIEAPQKK